MPARRVVEQAGAIVCRCGKDGPGILVVRARKTPDRWIFPKGHIERGESARIAAVRETREEAGVVARPVKALTPPIEFESAGERVRVRYYLLRATGETAPSESRERRWLSITSALRRLSHANARALLRSALPDVRRAVR